MKKALILIAVLAVIFISGCNKQDTLAGTTGKVSITIPGTSTAESTIPKEETTIFSTNPEACPKQFLRKQVKPDGSVEEYCLPPEYFRLKSCSTYKDCAEVEDCVNGYCVIFEEDVIA